MLRVAWSDTKAGTASSIILAGIFGEIQWTLCGTTQGATEFCSSGGWRDSGPSKALTPSSAYLTPVAHPALRPDNVLTETGRRQHDHHDGGDDQPDQHLIHPKLPTV